MTNDPNDSPQGGEITVTFFVAEETFPWTGKEATLLEFAEEHGIPISFGCTYGDCGTCLIDLIDGEVEYLHETGVTPEPGTCLPCSCRPKTSVILRA
jgi:ferredoxin